MSESKMPSMVSLNEIADLLRVFSRRSLGESVAGLADCADRCGCVGTNCDCHGRVFTRVFETVSYQEFEAMRRTQIIELKRQIEDLERRD